MVTAAPGFNRDVLGPLLAQVLVITTGAAVLVVETLAARLVAPYVGLTLESYTAAIGVALLGIATGARAGGILADRSAPRLVVTIALFGGGLLVLAVRPVIHLMGPFLPPGPASAIAIIAVSTLPPVLALSMVAPAVVKARLASLPGMSGSGSVVGTLSALGTLGALAGTFLTGFVLVATLPTTLILAVAAGACLLLAAVTAATRSWSVIGRAAGAAMLAGTALVGLTGPCEVETAYYCARIEADPEPGHPSGRVLYLDNLRHSYVDPEDPTYLDFRYTQRFADVVDAAFPGPAPLDVVHVGGGGFTMPRWLAATRPGTRSTVLELDPAVVALGRERLGVGDIPDLSIRTGDARISARSLPDASADVVVGDAFGSLSVPWHLATREFLADLRRVLRPGGVLVLNVIDYDPRRFLAAETATVAWVFADGDVVVLGRSDQLVDGAGGNFVVAASTRPLDRAALASAANARGEPGAVLDPRSYAEVVDGASVLTDDFAPVDQLMTPYVLR